MKILNQKGNVLLFAIVAFTLISVLGTGIYFMTTSAIFSGLGANQQNRAYQLAVAGRDYALAKNLTAANSGDFTMSNGDIFRLEICNQIDKISSTGIVGNGTPYEAKRTIDVTITGFCSRADIEGMQPFTTPAQSKPNFITPDTGTGQISLGKIGDEWKSSFGALWYKGSAASGNCDNGRCEFGTGFRAFFVYQISASAAGADGFTFTFFNGDTATNDFYSVGGDSGRGELLGYAGDSRIDSAGASFLDGNNRVAAGCLGILGCEAGRGIQPPKIAIEFDPYTNYGSLDVCASGSRRDGNESPDRQHAGYVFWGTNGNSSCTATVGRNSYDDNRHNEGTNSSSDPKNSRRPSDGADPSYYNASATWPYNWLTTNAPTNIYAFRVEVTRNKTTYEYIIKSWIKQCTVDIACTTYDDASSFANTKVDYIADVPTLTRTMPIQLTQELHNKFDTFFFGWTTATGGATQNVNISRFKMNFIKSNSACVNYGVWNNLGSAGSTTYFKINGAGCTGIIKDSRIGDIVSSGIIYGYTDAGCTNATSPSELTYSDAAAYDANMNCAVYFDATDK